MSEPEIVIDDAMIERAARALCDEGILALNGKPATWDQHADGFHGMARAALTAAFEGVPVTNYGIGLALQFFDLVICVKSYDTRAAAGVYRSDDPHEGFDALGHRLTAEWGMKPRRYLKAVRVSELDPPEER